MKITLVQAAYSGWTRTWTLLAHHTSADRWCQRSFPTRFLWPLFTFSYFRRRTLGERNTWLNALRIRYAQMGRHIRKKSQKRKSPGKWKAADTNAYLFSSSSNRGREFIRIYYSAPSRHTFRFDLTIWPRCRRPTFVSAYRLCYFFSLIKMCRRKVD